MAIVTDCSWRAESWIACRLFMYLKRLLLHSFLNQDIGTEKRPIITKNQKLFQNLVHERRQARPRWQIYYVEHKMECQDFSSSLNRRSYCCVKITLDKLLSVLLLAVAAAFLASAGGLGLLWRTASLPAVGAFFLRKLAFLFATGTL